MKTVRALPENLKIQIDLCRSANNELTITDLLEKHLWRNLLVQVGYPAAWQPVETLF